MSRGVLVALLLPLWVGTWILTLLVIGNIGLAANARWSNQDLEWLSKIATALFAATYLLVTWLLLRRKTQ